MIIVYVCFYKAYPPESGAAIVSYSLAKYALGESTLIQFGSRYSEEVTGDGVRVVTLAGEANNRWIKITGLYSRLKNIVESIEKFSPDLVVLEGASWVLFHWLLLTRIHRRLPKVKVAYHAHNIEFFLRKEKHGKVVTFITQWAERRLLVNSDYAFAVSEVDSIQFEKLYGIRPPLLPNGVDTEKFNQVTQSDIEDLKDGFGLLPKTILFMGSYLYKPNKEGVDFLINKVMPLVVQAHPDVQLAVIGGEVPYKRPWLLNPGSIPYEKLPAFVKACNVGVAPIFSGSGTRLKILEYMAAGKPTVSTTKGAEGLKVEPDKNILLAENASGFADAISKLLSDEEFSSTLGERGKECVKTNYSWSALMKDFNNTLRLVDCCITKGMDK